VQYEDVTRDLFGTAKRAELVMCTVRCFAAKKRLITGWSTLSHIEGDASSGAPNVKIARRSLFCARLL
jgi:hypothetical protein